MAEPDLDALSMYPDRMSPANRVGARAPRSRRAGGRAASPRERWRLTFREHATCRSSTRLLLWELAAYTDTSGQNAAPGVARLAAAAGVSPATVKRALDWGRANGWVVRTARGARRLAEPDSYSLVVPDAVSFTPHDATLEPAPATVRIAAPARADRIASMTAADFKATVLIPAYGVVAEAELDALRETYWTKLAAESAMPLD